VSYDGAAAVRQIASMTDDHRHTEIASELESKRLDTSMGIKNFRVSRRRSFGIRNHIMALGLMAAGFAMAADPQTYRVDLASTGNSNLDSDLKATSELVSLRDSAPVSPFGLIARARGESDRLKTVMESYGYYQSSVSVKIEGMALNAPGLADVLTALPKGRKAQIAVSFELGTLYHLRNVSLDGKLPDLAAGAFVLKSGAPAVAADVLGAGARLLTALQNAGYAFAKVDPPVAYEDPKEPVLDVTFHVNAGKKVNLGEIRLEGLQRVREKVVRRRLLLHTGQQYDPAAIEKARRDLMTLGAFAAITVQLGSAVDETGGVPLTFTFRERLRHAVTINAGYSSDLGGSGGVTWTDRNLSGDAAQLALAASVINLGGGDTNGLGYDTSAKYTVPDVGHRDQSLQVTVGAIKQYLEAYDQKSITASVTLSRKLTTEWSLGLGVAAAHEEIDQPGEQILPTAELPACGTASPPLGCQESYVYTLLALPFTLGYDSTHLASPLDDPTHGTRDALTVTPTRSLGHPSASFVITQIKLAAYLDLDKLGFSDPGRTVLAVRALEGVARGAGEFSLPPDQRFYGGGSATVRGYEYQSIGPQFFVNGNPSGIPIGGTAISAGTVELRQRFGQSWGLAAFVDGGQVSTTFKPVPSNIQVGVGLGLRYYTAIGPIRLDVAVPTRKSVAGQDAFELYIGLGQAF
jgi:translocation and assembly module TamA